MSSDTAAHTPARTCDQLGICQGRTIPCLNCTRPDAEPWPPADDATRVTPSSFELIWAWATTLLIAAAAVLGCGLLAALIVFVLSHWLG